jgi:hypothetical protein
MRIHEGDESKAETPELSGFYEYVLGRPPREEELPDLGWGISLSSQELDEIVERLRPEEEHKKLFVTDTQDQRKARMVVVMKLAEQPNTTTEVMVLYGNPE